MEKCLDVKFWGTFGSFSTLSKNIAQSSGKLKV